VKERRSVAIGLGFVLVTGALGAWLLSSTPKQMQETLRFVSPRAAEIAFLLLIAGAGLSFSEIQTPCRRGASGTLAVGLLALAAVKAIPPQTHRIYYDEDIYENVAQNILWMGRAQMCNEGTLEADTFDATRPSTTRSRTRSVSRFARVPSHRGECFAYAEPRRLALGAVALYWLSAMLFERASVGFGAALVYTLTPQNLWGRPWPPSPGPLRSRPSASARSFCSAAAPRGGRVLRRFGPGVRLPVPARVWPRPAAAARSCSSSRGIS
jgi:hypothetical protein